MKNLNSFQVLIFTKTKFECAFMCSMSLNNTPYNHKGDRKHKHIAKGKPNVITVGISQHKAFETSLF